MEVKILKYSFKCLCGHVMTTEVGNREEAINNLVITAKAHLAETHPELNKSDEEIKLDLEEHTVEGDIPEGKTEEGDNK